MNRLTFDSRCAPFEFVIKPPSCFNVRMELWNAQLNLVRGRLGNNSDCPCTFTCETFTRIHTTENSDSHLWNVYTHSYYWTLTCTNYVWIARTEACETHSHTQIKTFLKQCFPLFQTDFSKAFFTNMFSTFNNVFSKDSFENVLSIFPPPPKKNFMSIFLLPFQTFSSTFVLVFTQHDTQKICVTDVVIRCVDKVADGSCRVVPSSQTLVISNSTKQLDS